MGKVFAKIAAVVGGFVAATSTGACYWSWLDEPEMPKSLLK